MGLLQQTSRVDGTTVVLITHNQAFTAIADHVLHVRGGRIAGEERNEHPAEAATLVW